VTEALAGEGFVLRRARPEDVGFLVALASHEDVEPFMAAVAARTEDELLAAVELSLGEPEEHGRFVVEVDGVPVGAMSFDLANRRSRIAHVFGFMLHPDFRGRGLADAAARLFARYLLLELDFHRLQLEVYGYNERGLRHAERVGYVREGVKRRAYWRHEGWVDGVLFGLLREDLVERDEETSRYPPAP
jgi:RimJ/RimL family protein N-acetyltransferase